MLPAKRANRLISQSLSLSVNQSRHVVAAVAVEDEEEDSWRKSNEQII